MNQKLKKIAAAVLAAALMTGCAACTAPAGESQPESSNTESGAAASNFNESGYPIVNEPVTLKVLASKHNLSDTYTEQKTFQDLETKTNVKIEWQYAEGEDWNTQKPLLLASNDLPDVFMGGALVEADVINNAELFLDLTDYIGKYAPNVQAMFDETPAMKNMATAFDGKIYGLPHQMPCRPETLQMPFINQQWLKNLNLEMPTTTEEFEAVLKAFKEQDANGNGDPNDEIPMSFMAFNDLTGCLSLYGAFGEDVVDSYNDRYASVTDGKVQYIPILDNFKEGTKWLQKLFGEGLVDVEAFTNDWTTYPAKLNPEGDAKVGVGFHWAIRTGVGEERAQDYTAMMPLKGPKGDQYWTYNSDSVKSGKYFYEISASCQIPEIAMRWADALYDQETSAQLFYGPIGTTMEKKDDGTYEVLPPAEGMNSETWAWKFGMGDQIPGYVGDAFSAKITPPVDVQEKLAVDKELQSYLKDDFYPLVNLTKEQSDELAILSTDLKKYFQETVSGWIVNGGDIDAEWDAYVQQMKTMGADRYQEILQEAYDAYTK